METTVGVSGNLPQNPSRKQRGWIREAVAAAAEFHHKRHIPKHFKAGAATKYGYLRRSAAWQRRKQRLGKGTLPMVFTGQTRDSVMADYRIAKTSTRGARLIMRAALPGLTSGNYRMKLGQFRLSAAQERIEARRQELVAITDDEMTTLAAVEEATYQQQVDQNLTR